MDIKETVEVTGPAGNVVINKEELADYESRGYSMKTDEPPASSEKKPKGK